MNIAAIETIENFFGLIFERRNRNLMKRWGMDQKMFYDSYPLRQFFEIGGRVGFEESLPRAVFFE